MQIESFSTQPLQQVIESYVYGQFADDPDIQAFFAGLNTEGQGYLDWFLNTPLSVYTSPAISGPLLDWIGQGIYGISRPVISTSTTRTRGYYNAVAYDAISYNRLKRLQSGTAQVASDDIYKRTLTWYTYLGDGRQMSIMWLRRRVARFIFGVNGTDIPVDYLQQISIEQTPSAFSDAYGTYAYNTTPYNMRRKGRNAADHALQITVPAGSASRTFQALVNEGYLALPFQVKFTIVVA
jgi:hypothetical protein